VREGEIERPAERTRESGGALGQERQAPEASRERRFRAARASTAPKPQSLSPNPSTLRDGQQHSQSRRMQ